MISEGLAYLSLFCPFGNNFVHLVGSRLTALLQFCRLIFMFLDEVFCSHTLLLYSPLKRFVLPFIVVYLLDELLHHVVRLVEVPICLLLGLLQILLAEFGLAQIVVQKIHMLSNFG